MEDVAVETATDDSESPSDQSEAVESESPSVEAQAGTDQSTDSEDDEPEEIKRFLKSRGIDKFDRSAKKLVGETLFKTLNDNSGLSKRARELEAELSELRKQPRQPEPEPEPHPDLKDLDARITALKSQEESFGKRENDLYKQLRSQDIRVAVLQDKLAGAEDFDKPKYSQELAFAENNVNQTIDALNRIKGQKDELPHKLASIEREKRLAERFIKEDERARQELSEQTKRFNAEFPAQVDGFIERFANELKVVSDKDIRADLAENVNNELTVTLFRMSEQGIKNVDIAALVREKVEKVAKRYDVIGRTHLQKTSAAVRPMSRTPAKVTRPEPNRTLSLEEQVEQAKAARLERMRRLKA